ncbi:MAG TPA: CdaR family protein [Candidatus Dormibacteraeota bacterium]
MRLITNNWRLKLVALFIASTTWGVVAYAGNPVETKDVTRVAVQAGPPPNNWVIVNQLPTVTVAISGLHQSLVAFQSASLHATVDLARTRLGPNLLHVSVDNSDPRVAITAVEPASVDVVLDERDIVTKKVDLRFKNSPNNCCVAQNSKATVNPDLVRLSGPKSVLARALPYVQVDLSEAQTDVQQTLDVKLDAVDARAAPLVTIEPKQVQVSVPVTLVKRRAQAGLNETHVGQVAAGYSLNNIAFAPDVLTVEADPAILATVKTLDTPAINISGATGDIVQTVTVRPPAGVAIVGSAQVTVHFFITKNPDVQPSPSPSPSASPR